MLIVRPIKQSDADDLIRLARLAGPGFTSLAVSDDDLRARVKKSLASFKAKIDTPGDQAYLLVLEDTDKNQIVGMSAVKAQVGYNKPFFSFKLLNIVQSSNAADRLFNMEVMLLVNEYTGSSEVGTLFVEPRMRGTGAGRLIAQSRYMLIAAGPERFAENFISELRGRVDENGYSPFWEALGRKFFQMDFAEADKITAKTDNQFITDLMPKYPIYTTLLSDEAQAVIGRAHKDGAGARRLLRDEGFRYEKFVDIFDAGPTVAAPRDQIRTVKDSHVLKVKIYDRVTPTPTHRALVSNNKVSGFRSIYTKKCSFTKEHVCLEADIVAALEVKPGDEVRVFATRIGNKNE